MERGLEPCWWKSAREELADREIKTERDGWMERASERSEGT